MKFTTFVCLTVALLLGAVQQQQLQVNAAGCDRDEDCANGGECKFRAMSVHHGMGGYCVCSSGFWGQRCQDVCELQCLNGAQCKEVTEESSSSQNNLPDHAMEEETSSSTSETAQVECDCARGFYGTLCETREGDEDQDQQQLPTATAPSISPTKFPSACPSVVPTEVTITTTDTTSPSSALSTLVTNKPTTSPPTITSMPSSSQRPLTTTNTTTTTSLGASSTSSSEDGTSTDGPPNVALVSVLVVASVVLLGLGIGVFLRYQTTRKWTPGLSEAKAVATLVAHVDDDVHHTFPTNSQPDHHLPGLELTTKSSQSSQAITNVVV